MGSPLREARRRQILEAVVPVLSVRGIRLSMEEIAREVGISKATLYYYFPSREALLGAIYQEAWRQFFEAVQRIPERKEKREEFLEMVRALLWRFRAEPALFRVLFQITQDPGIELPEALRREALQWKERAYARLRETLRALPLSRPVEQVMREIGGTLFGYLRFGKEASPPEQQVLSSVERLLS